MKNEALLKVSDLTIGFPKEGGLTPVVDHISFTVGPGEILGIVGESGSGKSMTALAVMNLLPETAAVMDGTILYNNTDLIHAPEKELRELKGTQLAMIFQEPMTSLNPVMTVGAQVEEMLRLHEKLPERQYKERTVAAMLDAGLTDAGAVYHRYPHELSGGMRQRAMIAMAMIAGPKLLIADEPTTALDVTIQDKILMLLKKISRTFGTSIILVSHDLGVIKSICDRTLVMKDGQIVESGDAVQIFEHPKMKYTRELAAAAPANWMKRKLREDGSIFTEWEDKGKNREAAAPDEYSLKNNAADNANTDAIKKNIGNEIITKEENLLQVENLSVSYMQRTGKLFGKKQKKQVVKNASLYLKKGEILGIVGESGCGKTTLAKAIAGLIKDTDGTVRLSHRSKHQNYSDNAADTKASAAESEAEAVLSRPQMVFQDPYSSLNPARNVGWILEEPLKLHRGFSKIKRKARVKEVIQQVGLQEEHLGRYVSQLSGGQRQRVAIAAALILKPELIILDEPVSALDVTVQAQILDLLKMLQQKFNLSYLFISHDLNVIYKVCDRVCVMYQGEIVETGNTRDIFWKPAVEYTKELLKASLPG